MDQADTNKQGYRECKQDKKDYVKKKKKLTFSLSSLPKKKLDYHDDLPLERV